MALKQTRLLFFNYICKSPKFAVPHVELSGALCQFATVLQLPADNDLK
jgi:hypothetical protein